MFVDYEYYIDSFAGTLVPAEEFSALEHEAERLLGYVTQKKYLAVSDAETVTSVKKALCGAVEAVCSLNREYKDIPAGVSSESTDGHSVTFVKTDSAVLNQQRKKLMYDIFVQELFDTGLLYQGVS